MKNKVISLFLLCMIFGNILGSILVFPKFVWATSLSADIQQLTSILGIGTAARTAAEASSAAASALTVPVYDFGSVTANIGAEEASAVEETSGKIFEITGNWIERSLQYAAYVAFLSLLDNLTNQIIDYINGGFDKKPKFVTDWRSVLEDAASKGGGKFLEDLTGINICSFSPNIDFKLLLQTPQFRTNVKCSLEDIGETFANLNNDLRNGDWTSWIKLSQVPANNPYSVLLNAQIEKTLEEAREEQRVHNELMAGRGFLSPKKEIIDSDGKVIGEVITTPGVLLEHLSGKGITSQFEFMQDAASNLVAKLGPVGISIVSIGNALVNKLIKQGLSELGKLAQDSSGDEKITTNSAGFKQAFNSNILDDPNLLDVRSNVDSFTAQSTFNSYIKIINSLIGQLAADSNVKPLTDVNLTQSQIKDEREKLLICQNSKLAIATEALNICQFSLFNSCQFEKDSLAIITLNKEKAEDLKNKAENNYNFTADLISNYQKDRLISQSLIDKIKKNKNYRLSATNQVDSDNSGVIDKSDLSEEGFFKSVKDKRIDKAADQVTIYIEDINQKKSILELEEATKDSFSCQESLNQCSINNLNQCRIFP